MLSGLPYQKAETRQRVLTPWREMVKYRTRYRFALFIIFSQAGVIIWLLGRAR